MTALDDERLAQIRDNAAFAIKEFSGLTQAGFGIDISVDYVAAGKLHERGASAGEAP